MNAKATAAPRATFDETAKGVYLIAATPFDERGELDLDSADRMTDFYLQSGADGLTLLGVMGEAPKLTADESLRFV
ncbi:MAG TPA: dihydrodipicolinate synthase family protein, partial [Burkholderiaceae bacterium]|nr:dihydrodipicolinate synthase family protein [Burkholderiaceae bacterium]